MRYNVVIYSNESNKEYLIDIPSLNEDQVERLEICLKTFGIEYDIFEIREMFGV